MMMSTNQMMCSRMLKNGSRVDDDGSWMDSTMTGGAGDAMVKLDIRDVSVLVMDVWKGMDQYWKRTPKCRSSRVLCDVPAD